MTFEHVSKEINPNSPKIFTGSTEATSTDGWIDQNGIFYGCTTEEHDECAKFLLNNHKEFIIRTLKHSENPDSQEMIFSLENQGDYHSRMILQTTGFALLSSNHLSETNLPDKLTFPQMEFAKRNNIALMPLSGQLDYQSYQDFLESVKDWQKQQKTKDYYDPEERETFDDQINYFLNDPTGISYFWENDLVANDFYNILTTNSDAEVSVEAGKDYIIWRHIPLPSSSNVFLEFYYHDHRSNFSPLSETWIKLVDKQGINEFLNKKKESLYRNNLTGDLSIIE